MRTLANGKFIKDTAGYELNSLDLPSAWEYIYQNRDFLLKVDQFGPVYVQANPPGDILLLRRENGQRFSNWVVWICEEGQEPFNNFFRPTVNCARCDEIPDDLSIRYLPEKAMYSFRRNGLKIQTEFTMLPHGKELSMRFSVENTRRTQAKLRLNPYLIPYVNLASLSPWDKNEWYLRSGYGNAGAQNVFWTQLLNPAGDVSKRRTMVLLTPSEDLKTVELSLEKFIGCGSVYCPQYALGKALRMDAATDAGFGQYTPDNQIYGCPPVYAMQYDWCIEPGKTKTLVQTVSLPDQAENGEIPEEDIALAAKRWFAPNFFDENCGVLRQRYQRIFQKNRICTPNEDFNYYMNYWIPMQMDWVASLDRGWPSEMRGTRDSANDYMALLTFRPDDCREMLRTLFSCQRSDGWFLRQYSTKGRHGNHDDRPYVDGGVFVLEFLYRYFAFTGDYSLLEERLPWLDKDQESTLAQHMLSAVEYYLEPKNIGEHGLCKIYGGDWNDAVNMAGLQGRGESVMVSCQLTMALTDVAEILQKAGLYPEKAENYIEAARIMRGNILRHARNGLGWFNSVFNDDGKWIFSDRDPDGQTRPYGPVNYYAVISGTVEPDRVDDALAVTALLKSPYGYRLFYPPFGDEKIPHVGRQTTGDVPPFLAENGNVYNHGSQGFLARALAKAGKGDRLFDVLQWMLPYDQSRHPTELACTAPYAVTNCWQQLPVFDHRGMLSFLTGSVAMSFRGAYEWLMGAEPKLDGLCLAPCIPQDWPEATACISYRGREIHLVVKRGEPALYLNGRRMEPVQDSRRSYRPIYFLPWEQFIEKNEIEIFL